MSTVTRALNWVFSKGLSKNLLNYKQIGVSNKQNLINGYVTEKNVPYLLIEETKRTGETLFIDWVEVMIE